VNKLTHSNRVICLS